MEPWPGSASHYGRPCRSTPLTAGAVSIADRDTTPVHPHEEPFLRDSRGWRSLTRSAAPGSIPPPSGDPGAVFLLPGVGDGRQMGKDQARTVPELCQTLSDSQRRNAGHATSQPITAAQTDAPHTTSFIFLMNGFA